MTDMLLVFTAPVPGRETEYNDWYTNQHVPDIVALPGFARAQRFRSADADANLDAVTAGPPAPYLAVYEIVDGQIETAKASLAAAMTQNSWELSDAIQPGAILWYYTAASNPVDAPPA
jgi:hypothetical protein